MFSAVFFEQEQEKNFFGVSKNAMCDTMFLLEMTNQLEMWYIAELQRIGPAATGVMPQDVPSPPPHRHVLVEDRSDELLTMKHTSSDCKD